MAALRITDVFSYSVLPDMLILRRILERSSNYQISIFENGNKTIPRAEKSVEIIILKF